jgi:hypothetical protein
MGSEIHRGDTDFPSDELCEEKPPMVVVGKALAEGEHQDYVGLKDCESLPFKSLDSGVRTLSVAGSVSFSFLVLHLVT